MQDAMLLLLEIPILGFDINLSQFLYYLVPALLHSWVIKLSHLGAGKEAGKDFVLPRVEPPITKHIPIIEHFSIFYSFLNQIKQSLCHWTLKLKDYKCSWSVRSKGATQRTQEEDE
jgi:hypothetical protein